LPILAGLAKVNGPTHSIKKLKERLTAGFACGFELCQTFKVWQRRIGSAKGSGTLPILAGLAKVNGPTRSIKKIQRKTHRRLHLWFRTLPNLGGLAKEDRFGKGEQTNSPPT